MFVQGQYFIKKELIKRFSAEDFSWIDDIFPEEEEDEEEEGLTKDNPTDRISTENIIDIET